MGNKYQGNYENDERHGWGTMIWIDGSIYKGQWVGGIQQGLGIMIFNVEGAVKKRAGFFENNVFAQPLVNKAQVAEYGDNMPDDIWEEFETLLKEREEKIQKRIKEGLNVPSGSEGAFESEDEAVGKIFKNAIKRK
jgi:hypothetical protein